MTVDRAVGTAPTALWFWADEVVCNYPWEVFGAGSEWCFGPESEWFLPQPVVCMPSGLASKNERLWINGKTC
jgi:hypothetical protein